MSLFAGRVLLKLIPVLQVNILVHWLQLQDVAKLDSALSISKRHGIFLQILDKEYCVFINVSEDQDSRLLKWVLQRKLKLTRVELTEPCPSVERRTLFQTTGKHVRSLNISSASDNNMNDIVWEISTMCPNLEKLIFSSFDLSQVDISSILTQLPRLQHLDLSRCAQLTGEMLANIHTNAQKLRVLNLSGCFLHNGTLIAQPVQENHTIHTLTLGCSQVATCLPFVVQCKGLTTLFVSQIKLVDVFTVLTECPLLTTLSAGIDATQSKLISESELNTLLSLIQNLDVLHFYHGRYFYWKEGQLLRLIQGAPKLRALFPARIQKRVAETITETVAAAQCLLKQYNSSHKVTKESAHQLHTLLVDDISTTELENLLGICPQLVSLTIVRYGMINVPSTTTPDLMAVIAISSVRILSLSECDAIESEDFLPLCNLVSLSLHLCSNLEHTDLIELLQLNPALRKLSLKGCSCLSQQSVVHIIETCTCLEELVFDNVSTSDYEHTYVKYPDNAMDIASIEKSIKLYHPNIKLSLQLQPELP